MSDGISTSEIARSKGCISIVSRAACAVIRTLKVTTESIGVTVMSVSTTLVNI